MPVVIPPIRMEVIQQPVQARVCGFTPKDRRPINPCPIDGRKDMSISDRCEQPLIYVPQPPSDHANQKHFSESSYGNSSITNNNNSSSSMNSNNSTNINENYFQRNHSDQQQNSEENSTWTVSITDGYTRSFNLIGTLTSEAMLLSNPQNEDGLYFVFYDLAVRKTGVFKLKFDMYRLHDR
ncbi:hypothetical protein HK100_011085 [Physocladia obscura]|uniref:Velvet domain-containing protein n=1 Tax=Physocladia obscura TaxID=109957 RepID=A0AAD5T1Q7_9FUNG|nr:hypothetical protein HK100_011085 [Physocladia obscura]